MRRTDPDLSSFDLFLDTVCNAFGGIVFLAILMALMVQTRSVVKTTESLAEQAPTPDEIREWISQLDTLSAQHAALAETLANTPEGGVAPEEEEYRELMEASQQTEKELADATQKHAKATRELAEKLAENATLAAENAKIPADLIAANQSVGDKKTEYQAALDSKQETLRLPKSKQSDAASLLVLFKSGVVYLAKRPSLYGKGFNADHVTTKSKTDGGTEVRPVPGAGWVLASAAGEVAVKTMIDDAAADGFIITLAIWPECYEDFTSLREQMVSTGVPYQLWLQDDEEVLTVYSGTGAASVQ